MPLAPLRDTAAATEYRRRLVRRRPRFFEQHGDRYECYAVSAGAPVPQNGKRRGVRVADTECAAVAFGVGHQILETSAYRGPLGNVVEEDIPF